MGLSQLVLAGDNRAETPFVWYDHYRLHQFMQDIWEKNGAWGSVNGQYVVLQEDDIYDLEDALNEDGLPKAYVPDEGDEIAAIYGTQDKKFVEWAKECYEKGVVVIYTGSA